MDLRFQGNNLDFPLNIAEMLLPLNFQRLRIKELLTKTPLCLIEFSSAEDRLKAVRVVITQGTINIQYDSFKLGVTQKFRNSLLRNFVVNLFKNLLEFH